MNLLKECCFFIWQTWETKEEKHFIVSKQQSGKAETIFHVQIKEYLMSMCWVVLQY